MNESEKLYAFDHCGAWPLPGGSMLVRNPRNGRHAVLTPEVYGTLLGCRQFRTLEAHADHLVTADPALAEQREQVLEVLRTVQRDGLMIASDIYAVNLTPSPQPEFVPDKPVVAVITWERPDALKRCLESLAEHSNLDNAVEIWVIDDSRTESVRQSNREATETLAARTETPVNYLGAAEQKAFMEAIIRGVPGIEEQVRFLVDRERWASHWTSGLARTWSLLVSVGRRLVVLDDDIVCEVFEPEAAPGVSFADDTREATFFTGREDWTLPAASEATDPILRHLRLLGSELKDALGALGTGPLSPASFAGADLDAMERFRNDSRVLITECGSIGDAGSDRLNWLVGLEGASRDRLLGDEHQVRNAFEHRSCWTGRRRPRIGAGSNLSQLTGIDHRALLPPYIPILRGEDRLFGDMVSWIHPHSAVIEQPWAIAHLPIPPRNWPPEAQRFYIDQPFPAFAASWVTRDRGEPGPAEPLGRLARVARRYEDLAEMDDAALRRLADEERLGALTRDYRELLEARQAAGDTAPERWRAFLDDALARIDQALVDNPPDRPIRGYPATLENEALLAWWREFWRGFARALRAWPAIRQAARQARN